MSLIHFWIWLVNGNVIVMTPFLLPQHHLLHLKCSIFRVFLIDLFIRQNIYFNINHLSVICHNMKIIIGILAWDISTISASIRGFFSHFIFYCIFNCACAFTPFFTFIVHLSSSNAHLMLNVNVKKLILMFSYCTL